MRLLVTTPQRLVVDAADAVAVRAEDGTGWFGVLGGHADFLTVLEPSVVAWRDRSGAERFVAVQGGVLTVLRQPSGGTEVRVATPEAVAAETLDQLERDIRDFGSRAQEEECQTRTDATRLQLAAMRHIRRFIEAGGAAAP